MPQPDSKTTELNTAAHPDEIPAMLRLAAEYAYSGASECESAWQDKNAGKPWTMVGRELERAADRIKKRLP